MAWLLGIFGSTIGRYLMAALAAAVVAGGFILWHKWEYVPREALNQWKDYAANLNIAIEKRDNLLKQYEEQKVEDDLALDKLEAEREKLLQEDLKRPNPVILNRDDAKRLRDFQKRTR